jgi:HD-GYP domain-containing protein (c-di-GMP phosphodiesterase class II)
MPRTISFKPEPFLHSKVGRRIFGLFIACALLPITVLTLVSSGFVSRQLEGHGRERLHQMAKSAGMELFRTVESADDELTLAAAFIAEGETLNGLSAKERLVEILGHSFRALELIAPDGTRLPLLDPLPLPGPTVESHRKQLILGETRLSVLSDSKGRHHVLLGRSLEGEVADGAALIGELDMTILERLRDFLPGEMQLAVLGPAQKPLVLPEGWGAILERERLLHLEQTATGQFQWKLEGEPQVAGYWTIFLEQRFGSPHWAVVISEPRTNSLASLARLGRLLPLFVLLCLMVVALMSMAQIRKSMVPLHKLREGTERLAQGRFDSKVEVDSGDEFESLADSFNTMAADLERQFRALNNLAEIDRAILSTVEEDRIVQTILDRLVEHYSVDSAAVALMDRGGKRSMTVHVRWSAGVICDTVDRVTFDAGDQWRLTAASGGHLVWSGSEIPDFLRELKSQQIEHCLVLPLIVRHGVAGCIALGSTERPALLEADHQDLRRLANQAAVALSNARMFEELECTNWELLRALARAVDANSPWTAGHSERVTAMAVKLGARLGLDEEELAVLHRGGLLHDLGKIGIASEILDKPGKLSEPEMSVMQSHPAVGARILEPISAFAREIPIVLYHHERYDGRGYPEGLAGDAIPRDARILTIADVFDALISDRPYRKPWSVERVIAHIQRGAGTHFDPRFVPEFLRMIEQETLVLAERANVASIRELFDRRLAVHP